jgi:hypothetical protein
LTWVVKGTPGAWQPQFRSRHATCLRHGSGRTFAANGWSDRTSTMPTQRGYIHINLLNLVLAIYMRCDICGRDDESWTKYIARSWTRRVPLTHYWGSGRVHEHVEHACGVVLQSDEFVHTAYSRLRC